MKKCIRFSILLMMMVLYVPAATAGSGMTGIPDNIQNRLKTHPDVGLETESDFSPVKSDPVPEDSPSQGVTENKSEMEDRIAREDNSNKVDPSIHATATGESASDAVPMPSVVTKAGTVEENYRLGCGDVIEISVWKDETLSKIVSILPDGNIHFPLLGQIEAEGLTVLELKKNIEESISRYIPDPVVHIGVQQIGSMMIYVIGKVNGPGRYGINSNINVLQALAMARGLNPFAKRDKIKILRQNGNETVVHYFQYDHVVDGTDLTQNIDLQRGDIVVVP